MDKQELKRILAGHKNWLSGKGGNRANLRDADLRHADLYGADLTDADLYGADLTGADLRYAKLTDADLREAKLIDADLRYSKLTVAYRSEADQRREDLYGADL